MKDGFDWEENPGVADGARVGRAAGGEGVLVAVGEGVAVLAMTALGRGRVGAGVANPLAARLTSWQAIKNRATIPIPRRIINEL